MFLDDIIEFSLVAVFCIVLVVVPAMFLVGFGNTIKFQAFHAAIEQLRQDTARVDASESEDIMGQVTATNQEIASQRAYNRIPFVCLVIPNGWDRLAPIELPQR